uniref:Uncharacterized protein n=1 Tax=Macrostomum lignano TaxID=282301 RepID=A0A1I8FHH8_9PLAT
MRKKLHRTALHYFSSMNLAASSGAAAGLPGAPGRASAGHLRLFRLANEFADKRDLDTLSGNARGLLPPARVRPRTSRHSGFGLARLESAYPDAVFLPDDFETVQAGSPAAGQPVRLRSREFRGYLMHRCRPGAMLRRRRAGPLGAAALCAAQPAAALQIEARRRAESRPIAIHLRGDGATGLRRFGCPRRAGRQAQQCSFAANEIAAIAEAANAAEGGEDVDSDEDDNEARVRDALQGGRNRMRRTRLPMTTRLCGWTKPRSSGPRRWRWRSARMTSPKPTASAAAWPGAAFSRQFPARLVGRCRTKPDAVVDSVLAAAASSSSTSEQQQQQQVLAADGVRAGRLAGGAGQSAHPVPLPLSPARIWPASRRLFGLTAAAAPVSAR